MTRARWITLALAALWVLVDQITKSWAVSALVDRNVDLIGSLRFNLAFNTGMAFSQGDGLGTVIGLFAACVVVALVVSLKRTSRICIVGTALVIGGALGNLADRAFRGGGPEDSSGFLGGAVVDFIDLQWWPIFNVADIGVTVGAVLLVIGSLRDRPPTDHPTPAAGEPELGHADADRDASDRA
jgi:signal peptidase II